MRARSIGLTAGVALALSLVAASPPADAESFPVQWRRLECAHSGQPEVGAAGFTCGHRDGLAIGYQVVAEGPSLPTPPPGCDLAERVEVPAVYAEPGPHVPTSGAPVPCAGGACLCEGTAGCRQSWIAIIDWRHWHGWTLASLIRSASESAAEVVLFDLEKDVANLPFDEVTDLQVLARLCEVLEEAESSGPPLAVNMSFGRLPQGGFGGSPDSLSSEISQVLDRLSQDHGVLLVAAAGNHRRLLFPAAHPAVTAVGALQLSKFLTDGAQPRPSWETPPGPSDDPPGKLDAVFPANGLCLPVAGGSGEETFWRAPPGASYAAALATGWISLARQRGLVDWQDAQPSTTAGGGWWHPMRAAQSTDERYLLARGGSPMPGTGSDSVDTMFRVLRDGAHPCWQPLGATARTVLECPGCSWGNPRSLDEFVGDRTHGTPSTHACVPCSDTASSGSQPASSRLVVNLSASPPVPDGIQIKRIQLRVGDTFYNLGVSTEVKDLLEQGAEQGGIHQLVIDGVEAEADLSLRFKLRDTLATDQEDKSFWTSVPILSFDPDS